MKTAHDIILKPVITENSMAGIADKKYTFKVATDATKVEIAQAVEVLFPGVKVAKVNTVSVRGRFRRQGMHAGYTAASKKAIVTLTKDSKEIDFFNSMVYAGPGQSSSTAWSDRTRRGSLYGDMTPIIIHKINKGE